MTKEEFEAQTGLKEKTGDRFVTIEEVQAKVEEHKYGVAYYSILIEALERGDFVIYNEKDNAYRVIGKNQPDFIGMSKKH